MRSINGIDFNISGKPRIEERSDGLYVVGNDVLIPVSAEKADEVLKEEIAAYDLEKRALKNPR